LFAEITVRSRGKAPELWHADTGRTEMQAVFDFTPDGRTRMPLWLEPNGSVFVVLRRAAGRHIEQLSKDGAGIFPWSNPAQDPAPVTVQLDPDALTTEAAGRYTLRTQDGRNLAIEVAPAAAAVPVGERWSVRFAPGWGAPESVVFDRLQSWSEHADPGIRYFSGTATYTTKFTLTEAKLAILDLGNVREIAEVKLNGHNLGILWKRPFVVALGSAAKVGDNELEISITNLWPNRLIGDQNLPPEQRRTHTNITKFHANSPLMPSGLLGPVTLRFEANAH
jgi:hypothetical protein